MAWHLSQVLIARYELRLHGATIKLMAAEGWWEEYDLVYLSFLYGRPTVSDRWLS